jgi:hypothetical protein
MFPQYNNNKNEQLKERTMKGEEYYKTVINISQRWKSIASM